jgi:hypothetical protein
MKIMEREDVVGRSTDRRSRPVIVVLLAALIVVAVAVGWLALRGDDDRSPTDVVQDLAAAMRTDDMDLLAETTAFGDTNFLEWQIGWNAQPVFSDITENTVGEGMTRVSATVTYGDESFYSQVLGTTLTTTLRGTVYEDGTFSGSDWPPPTGLTTVESELHTWITENRPELEDRMFGADAYGILFSRESGELRIEVLDEFMASRS